MQYLSCHHPVLATKIEVFELIHCENPFSSKPFKLELSFGGARKNTFSAPRNCFVSGYVPGPSLLQLGLGKVYWGNISPFFQRGKLPL